MTGQAGDPATRCDMLAILLTLQSAPPPPPHHSLPIPAVDPTAWITADDYPLEALRNNQEGTVRLAIAVDKSGKAVGCIVEVSSGASSLDEAGCTALMARASFRPARTGRGKAVAGIWKRSINWRIPRGVDAKTVPVNLRDEGGTIVCEVIDKGATRRLAGYLCAGLKDALQRSRKPLTGVIPVQLPDRPDIFELDPARGLESFTYPPK